MGNTRSPVTNDAGRGWGIMVLALFGGLWLYNAVLLSGLPAWSRYATLAVTAVLVVAGIFVIRAAGNEDEPPRDPRIGRRFFVIFFVEGAAIAAAIAVLALWHLENFIVPAIAAIVGLHFFPLAPLFRSPMYVWTGAAMVACAAASLAIGGGLNRDIAVAAGCGTILWGTALLRLLRR